VLYWASALIVLLQLKY